MIYQLFANPLFFVVWAVAIIVALSVHEFSHALMANKLGDPTAERSGRLTLNPLAHIDPLGFLMLIVAGFGWGRPVPFNPYNLRAQRWGPSLVAFAGPLANLITFFVSGALLKTLVISVGLGGENLLVAFLYLLMLISGVLFVFNLIPIPPLDGSKFLFSILSSPKYERTRFLLETRGPFILLALIILDNFLGVHLLSTVLGGVLSFMTRWVGVSLMY